MLVSLNPFHHKHSFEASKAKLSLIYHACLLCQLPDINPNPGPIAKGRQVSKWLCGDCHKNVNWKQKGIYCENCETWFHASCQGMHTILYEVAGLSNMEWECTNCGVPNFSMTLFDLSSLEHSNRYSVLSDNSLVSSPGVPQATSSPTTNPPTPKTNRNYGRSKVNTLRVVNMNFQSVLSKKAELHHLINSTKPDIIIRTQTWLHDGIRTQEFLPEDLGYCIYRSNRKKGSDHHVGVLICVTKQLISDPVPELETDCEIL